MLRTVIFSLIVCLASSNAAWGQDLPKPGPEHEKLMKMAGTWDAVMEFGGQKSKCTATYKSICGGMWLASDFEGDLGGIKFQGHGLDGYDQFKKKYVGMWVDSMGSSPLHMEGDFDPKTKSLVMTGTSRSMEGKPEKFKAVTETKDDNHFTFKMLMVGEDGKETPAFTIEYSRKK